MTLCDKSIAADLIILGGGCAGLSLASRLADQDEAMRVVVVEARRSYEEDRTWCGWRTGPHFFSDCVKREWHEWQVVTTGGTFRRGSQRYSYELIKSDCFYEKACRVLSNSRSANLILGTQAREVSESESGVVVTLADGRSLQAPWVVDTRPQPRVLEQPWLWQNFVGYVVDFAGDCNCFSNDIPTLMDFQPADGSVAQFVYLLPLTANSYLCEWTQLSPKRSHLPLIEARLVKWLRQQAGSSWRVSRRESGCLPMALPLEERRQRVVSAGMRGGSMRASSGYAFHAIQRWAEACTSAMQTTGRPIAPLRNRLLEALDAGFLRVLHQKPAPAADIFGRLFSDCEPDHLVRFLAGIPQSEDYWPVIRSLPWSRFLPTVPQVVSTWCKA